MNARATADVADTILAMAAEHGADLVVVGSRGHNMTLVNTGPFTRELNGRIHTFVHNGNLRCSDNFRESRSSRFEPVGETGSELAFCKLLENVAALPRAVVRVDWTAFREG